MCVPGGAVGKYIEWFADREFGQGLQKEACKRVAWAGCQLGGGLDWRCQGRLTPVQSLELGTWFALLYFAPTPFDMGLSCFL